MLSFWRPSLAPRAGSCDVAERAEDLLAGWGGSVIAADTGAIVALVDADDRHPRALAAAMTVTVSSATMHLSRLALVLLSLATATTVFAACSSDDDTTPGTDAGTADTRADGATKGEVTDSGAAHDAATSDAAKGANDCPTAASALASSADAQAPVLDAAKSNLQRVTSGDASCVSRKNGANPTYGAYFYLLNVFFHDAEGDGPTLDELSTSPGPVRFGAAPAFAVTDKFDPAHAYTTQGEGFILQLCLDQEYPAGSLTIAVDVADKAGHRSKAICISEATGF